MNRKILVVDDCGEIRSLLSRKLIKIGWDVTLAESAEQALEMMKSDEFDVIHTDMDMPGMTGLQFAAWVLTENPQARMVMFSGTAEERTPFLFSALGGLRFYDKRDHAAYFEGMKELLNQLEPAEAV